MRWRGTTVLIALGVLLVPASADHADAMFRPRISVVEAFLADWTKDRYRDAATRFRSDAVEVLVDGTTKFLRKAESRFEIGLHPVHFKDVAAGDGAEKIRVRCVKVSTRQFGREYFAFRSFEFDVPDDGKALGIVRIEISQRGASSAQCS